jgi:6-phosphogluconolactonase
MPEIHRFSNLEICIGNLVDDIAACLLTGVENRGRGSLAVSGGRTPEHIFPVLSQSNLPWDKLSVTLADERWVDPGHPDSNEGLARRLLIQGAAATARFVGLKTNHSTPAEGQTECEAGLSTLDWPLDAMFLGMGEDGHIASLFPGENWADAPGRALPVAPSGQRQARMSLTPEALLDSRHIYLVIKGKKKRQTFETAMKPGSWQGLPVRLILQQHKVPVSVYVVD